MTWGCSEEFRNTGLNEAWFKRVLTILGLLRLFNIQYIQNTKSGLEIVPVSILTYKNHPKIS